MAHLRKIGARQESAAREARRARLYDQRQALEARRVRHERWRRHVDQLCPRCVKVQIRAKVLEKLPPAEYRARLCGEHFARRAELDAKVRVLAPHAVVGSDDDDGLKSRSRDSKPAVGPYTVDDAVLTLPDDILLASSGDARVPRSRSTCGLVDRSQLPPPPPALRPRRINDDDDDDEEEENNNNNNNNQTNKRIMTSTWMMMSTCSGKTPNNNNNPDMVMNRVSSLHRGDYSERTNNPHPNPNPNPRPHPRPHPVHHVAALAHGHGWDASTRVQPWSGHLPPQDPRRVRSMTTGSRSNRGGGWAAVGARLRTHHRQNLAVTSLTPSFEGVVEGGGGVEGGGVEGLGLGLGLGGEVVGHSIPDVLRYLDRMVALASTQPLREEALDLARSLRQIHAEQVTLEKRQARIQAFRQARRRTERTTLKAQKRVVISISAFDDDDDDDDDDGDDDDGDGDDREAKKKGWRRRQNSNRLATIRAAARRLYDRDSQQRTKTHMEFEPTKSKRRASSFSRTDEVERGWTDDRLREVVTDCFLLAQEEEKKKEVAEVAEEEEEEEGERKAWWRRGGTEMLEERRQRGDHVVGGDDHDHHHHDDEDEDDDDDDDGGGGGGGVDVDVDVRRTRDDLDVAVDAILAWVREGVESERPALDLHRRLHATGLSMAARQALWPVAVELVEVCYVMLCYVMLCYVMLCMYV